MRRQNRVIISCEHGGNNVPQEYQKLFRGKQPILESHRGLDRGALILARCLAAKLKAPLFASTTTRLLIDLNRSLHHRHLFSEFTRHCDPAVKKKIIENYYSPYRENVEMEIYRIARSGETVVHLSIHSFTPRFRGVLRRADIGLLYDPQRPGERKLCRKLQSLLNNTADGLITRRNYPYRGSADGFTTYLRKKYDREKYLGIEIELNQNRVGVHSTKRSSLLKQIVRAVELAMQK